MNKQSKNDMDSAHVQHLAQQLLRGELSLDNFLRSLVQPKTADLGDVQLDLDRPRRCGFPEVIFGEGKTRDTLQRLIRRMLDEHIDVLATRIAPDIAAELIQKFPTARYNEVARTLRVPLPKSVADSKSDNSKQQPKTFVAIVTAGTTDIPVAEEARETLSWMGVESVLIHDVGVAGPHRFPEKLPMLHGAAAAIVVAGMEGALPSVVGGYVPCPVIAVPTSVGYGASCGGLAALLSMLNSCAANVTVVNVDAGFKAGYVAGLIAHGAAARTA
ncbi:MAG TPA: nickel pincer cofactor biosynthesis protein LarB [Pirellulales bacterium]|nr:nickel pincer cofactor biosynthesis protein LarB [Pirellulales bacterium]